MWRWTQKNLFSWKWQWVQPQRCGLVCLGLWADNGNKWLPRGLGLVAEGRVFSASPPPLEAVQLAYLCKAFGSSFLFKSISDSEQSAPWGAEIHRFVENLHMLSWKKKGSREGWEGWGRSVVGAQLPNTESPRIISIAPSHHSAVAMSSRSLCPTSTMTARMFLLVDWTPPTRPSECLGFLPPQNKLGGGEGLEGGVSLGSHKWVMIVGKGCLRKPTQNSLPRNNMTGPIKPTFGSNYNMPALEHFHNFPMVKKKRFLWKKTLTQVGFRFLIMGAA